MFQLFSLESWINSEEQKTKDIRKVQIAPVRVINLEHLSLFQCFKVQYTLAK